MKKYRFAVIATIIFVIVASLVLTSAAKPQLSEVDMFFNSTAIEYAETYHRGSTVSENFEDKKVNGKQMRVWNAEDANGMAYQISLPLDVINGPEEERVFESAIQMSDNHDWLIAKDVLPAELGELGGAFSTMLTSKTTCSEDELTDLYATYQETKKVLAAHGVERGLWVEVRVGDDTITFCPF